MTKLVGILNITPDSFSDGGLFTTTDSILNQIRKLKIDGADIIDIGAQATGPNSLMLDANEELHRLKIALNNQDIRKELSTIPFSIDTYNWEVAEFGLQNGASYINDISGLRFSSKMVDIIREYNAHIILMHSKEKFNFPHASTLPLQGDNLFDSLESFFKSRIDFACKHGIAESKIILDPGMGKFLSLNPHDSMLVIDNYHLLKELFPNFDFLYGLSRKGFIAQLFPETNLETKSKELEKNLIDKGVSYIRTHNVKALKELITGLQAHRYYLALGGNIGDTKAIFHKAIEELKKIGQNIILSRIYKSKPLPTTHGIKQDPYLNAVIQLESKIDPYQMLKKIQNIEELLGRDRVNYIHWGPRTLDIDIISCDDLRIEDKHLTIPHPRMLERDFVLIPINDIDQSYTHPISKLSIKDLINSLEENQKYIAEVID